ncbi:putative 4-coumarate--CoA ligase 3 [Papilio xuthus]|uniref:Luciferin 4-monooxygenase n=1 Tax=Papilio xuthus TaxID=66420 RepID=A0A194QGE2_PAPXU|nr:putative 4-coumarate--CoA ligase 3 [Papilio xuthus]
MARTNFGIKNIQKFISIRSFSKNARNLWSKDNIVSSPSNDVQLPSLTVNDFIWENIEKWAEKPAMVCGITNRTYTYHQLYKYSRRFGAKLRTLFDIREDDVTCIMMSNNPEYAVATLGSLEAGATVTIINPIYTVHEVQRQLILSCPKIVIGMPETIEILKEACKLAKLNIPIITVTNTEALPAGTISFHELINDEYVDTSVLQRVNKDIDRIALLPHSSGTTGLPKAVELVHRTLVANFAQQNGEAFKYCQSATESSQESLLAVLPFYHIYGSGVIMLHKLSMGAKVVTLPKFEKNTFLNAIKQQKSSILHLVPPLASFLASHPECKKEDLSNVHTYICGAAPLPKQDIFRILDKSKSDVDFLQIYGLTEVSPLATTAPLGSKNYATVGVALPNTKLRIVNSKDESLGPNEVGELLIKGPQVMKGYKDNPEATKAAITDDGWFRSGDLASIDQDGVVTICDRIKELIKVKGFQVAPAELESVLKEHSDVLDVAVIGVPDSKMGEVPKAFVVVKEGSSINSNDLKQFVEERVAAYKRLSDVTFIDSLPRNPSGKILRRVLKEKYV